MWCVHELGKALEHQQSHEKGASQWYEPTSPERPISDRSCRKRSNGIPSPKPGPYVVRVKVPLGVKLMPHKHPEDRIYTVMSGVFYIGLGEQFDGDKVKAYPPGSVIVLPGDTPHFHWAKSGEYVTQVTAIGPLGLEYIDAKDDPRHIA
jgi:quercetin dioxygenase-like cupin family protein